jgi:hypothetical protein
MKDNRNEDAEMEMEMDASLDSVSTKSCNSNSSSNKNQRKPKSSKKRQKKSEQIEKKVSFGTTQILEFTYTIGHQSVTENGPPVSLSCKLVRSHHHDVDSYEKSKAKAIFTGDGIISSDDRIQILLDEGFSRAAIERADEESKRVRIQRKQSILQMHWDLWYERKERMHRRVKRWTNPRGIFTRGSHLMRGSSSGANTILAF